MTLLGPLTTSTCIGHAFMSHRTGDERRDPEAADTALDETLITCSPSLVPEVTLQAAGDNDLKCQCQGAGQEFSGTGKGPGSSGVVLRRQEGFQPLSLSSQNAVDKEQATVTAVAIHFSSVGEV